MDDPARGRPLIDRAGDATLVLLRHGESTAIVEGRFQGRSDVPLSPFGVRQAERAAERLARPLASPALPVPAGPPTEIVHSPLARASQTAAALGRAVGAPDAFGRAVPLRPDADLSEISQGEWEGRLTTDIERRWGDTLRTWRRRPTEAHAPGGESLSAVQHRVRGVLDRAMDRLDSGQVGAATASPVLSSGGAPARHPWSIVVAHDGVFKVVLLTLFDLPLDRFWLFPFALCGITVVEVASGRPRLLAHNLTEHLAPLLEERAREATEERERAGAL